jgi:D-alanyl-lipoteichoic acid acyltransferase DltB (MBOAT superfamily)
LLVVSLAYYATWGLAFAVLPLALSLLAYVTSRLILAERTPSRGWMRLGVLLVVAVLGFFKYRVFFLDSLNAVTSRFGLGPVVTVGTISLPLGISFYSFQCISYLIDTAQGRVGKPSLKNLSNFLTFWPNLTSGPIARARELIPQFKFEKGFESRFLIVGLDRVIWGLVQKNVFANSLGAWVDEGFRSGRLLSTLDAWFLAVAFGLQVYLDFAGYSNMAIGTAQLLGIKLPENFRYPYHASNPSDFWSRWHMTLTRWIRDYLFFPANARFRGAPVPLYLSLIGIMSLVGLWHGAGWGFIVWGTMHGLYLTFHRFCETLVEARGKEVAALKWWNPVWSVFTLIAVTVAWVPFRAHRVSQTKAIWKSMFAAFSSGASFASHFYIVTLLLVLFCAVEPYLVGWVGKIAVFGRDRVSLPTIALARFVVYCCGLLLFMVFRQREVQFIYFQF